MPAPHVIRDDDGEYFDEDVTFGLNTQPDTAADIPWKTIPTTEVSEKTAFGKELLDLIRSLQH
jgi:hypothetical protein